MGTSVISTAGTHNGCRIPGLKRCMERHTHPKRKVVLQWLEHKGRRYRFKMFLPESSTNTDGEVFKEPCGLNKLLWKVKRGIEG